MSKYTVYENDLKYKKMRDIDPEKAIWSTDDIETKYHTINYDTLEYRLRQCEKDNFESLDLSHLEIAHVPELKGWKHYDRIKDIKCLFLNNNNMKKCDENFRQFENLEVLDISNNELISVDFLPYFLKEFVCSENKIVNMISHSNILRLDCSSNKLEGLYNYKSLIDLICDDNKLKTINTYENVTRIICKNNPLIEINTQPNVKYLDCSSTDLKNSISNMPKLNFLICNKTRLNDISNLTQLKGLEICHSDITKIPFIESLEDLLYKQKQEIMLSSKFKISFLKKEKDYCYIKFLRN